jgi:hypothetical protein
VQPDALATARAALEALRHSRDTQCEVSEGSEESPLACLIRVCPERAAPGDIAYCADHRALADSVGIFGDQAAAYDEERPVVDENDDTDSLEQGQ